MSKLRPLNVIMTDGVVNPQKMSKELSKLMDEIDLEGKPVDSTGTDDPRLLRIEYLANYLDIFYPELLDSRFSD